MNNNQEQSRVGRPKGSRNKPTQWDFKKRRSFVLSKFWNMPEKEFVEGVVICFEINSNTATAIYRHEYNPIAQSGDSFVIDVMTRNNIKERKFKKEA